MSILDDIATHLETGSPTIVGGSTGWTLFKGLMPDSPDQAVALYETGGPPPGQEKGGTRLSEPTFQVRVRAGAHDYSAARTKIQEVFAELDDATISGYIFVFPLNAGPLPLGQDTNERPHLTWNFRTMVAR
jgi:hypothetical protein